MLYGIVGRPGGGKSYEAVVYHVFPTLEKRRKIITNLPLNVDLFAATFGEEIRDLIVVIDGKLAEFGSTNRPFSSVRHYDDDWRNKHGQGPLYLIDEAHMVLPARGCDVKILEWYSMHRHLGIDIVLITQNLRKINRDIKDMIELTYSCQKNTALGSPNTYTQKVRTGSGSEVVNTSLRKYEKQYFKYYQSHTSSNKAVQEAYASDVKPIWKNWTFYGAGILLVIAILIFYRLYDVNQSTESVPDIAPVTSDPSTDAPYKPVDNVNPEFKTSESKSYFSDTFNADLVPMGEGDLGLLYNYDFYFTGEAHSSKFHREGDILSSLSSLSLYYFDVYLNDKKMFSTDNIALQNLGYEVVKVSDCIVALGYMNYRRVVTCAPDKDDFNGEQPVLAKAFKF